eukprot:scaffold28551_cov101-Isochrysis_galbana.AAC.2
MPRLAQPARPPRAAFASAARCAPPPTCAAWCAGRLPPTPRVPFPPPFEPALSDSPRWHGQSPPQTTSAESPRSRLALQAQPECERRLHEPRQPPPLPPSALPSRRQPLP